MHKQIIQNNIFELDQLQGWYTSVVPVDAFSDLGTSIRLKMLP